MLEQHFRYVAKHRVAVWERAGWAAISAPLAMKAPAGMEGAPSVIEVRIMEWQGEGLPIEPKD